MKRINCPRHQACPFPGKKRVVPFALTLALALLLSGCGGVSTSSLPGDPSGDTVAASGPATENPQDVDNRLVVVTTLFPQYDFVRILAGDRVSASLLLPPGIEPHTFEPTPKDIVKIGQADLFIYTGGLMEPWAERILEGVQRDTLTIVDTSADIALIHGHAHGEEHEEDDAGSRDHDGDDTDAHAGEDTDTHDGEATDTHAGEGTDAQEEEEGADPHIWLDPLRAAQMVQTIADALIAADPAGESQYRENATTYIAELHAYDNACKEAFLKVDTHTIVYGGHFAFGYFAQRYGLDHVSPYTGFSPDAEPTPRRIAELIDRMRETGSNTIYYEELVDPKVAEVISASTGAEMLLLHGAHNLSREELEAGATYLGIMQENLEKLKKGLGYHE